MLFKDIIGQDAVKARLRQAVQDGRISHAMLFTGAGGVGKLPLALALAQYMACPNRTPEDSCGKCPTCLQYQKLQHPDLFFAYPVVKPEGKSEVVCDDYGKEWRQLILERPYFDLADWYEAMGASNKQGMIYEKESSEILRKLSLKAYGSGFKVMIIWLPEKMNEVCANKLLKIIEEPPQKTVFILVSEEHQRLLQTILSRVQEVPLPRLSEDEITAALRAADDELSASDAIDFAHMANGSYLTALKLMRADEQNQQFFDWFVALMRNAWSVGHRQDYDCLLELRKWAAEMSAAGREKQKAFLEYAQRQVREYYVFNFGLPEINYQTAAERQFAVKFAPFINENNVQRLMDQLQLAQRQIEQNGSARIIFFDLCLQTIVLIK
ncbi:MAG: DNA polymerase III subunit delta [Bacteroidales bacterium]|nr:DNA polymerase III subunit delta [Candidatus Colicola faecequi]